MAKTSVYSRPMPNASLPRNSFPRGFMTSLNWSAGMLLPVFCKEVPKGSHCRIDRSIFMRTAQLNTAAFPKMDNHIDFFKVPKRLLMTRYEEFLTNTADANSSGILDGNNGFGVPVTAPYIRRQDIYTTLNGTYTDIIGDSIFHGAQRLLDLLGYDHSNCIMPSSADPFETNLNAFRLLAYQKIYYDHFRNTAYESNNPMDYNADWWYGQGVSGSNPAGMIGTPVTIAGILTLRYANVRRDYFTNLYPALNYVFSSPSGVDWQVPDSVVLGARTSAVMLPRIQSSTSMTALTSTGNAASLSVQSIRAAFALDKLLRASAYTPKHVRDQIEARFGVKCSKKYGNESEYLGSFMNDIVIGEVTSTANTLTASSGDALGAIGGKGVSGDKGGHVIEFDTNEDDCIIMGVMYSLCRSMYDSRRIDAFNAKFTKEDYFQPEFMNLGLRPLYQYELYTVSGPNAQAYSNQIRGYVPRYQEYKVSIDENHGLFNNGNLLSIFTPHFNFSFGLVLASGPGVTAAYFKMAPKHLDSIFAQQYDASDQGTDQFYGLIQFKFDARQNMSVHGQPSL